jgi:hypothetical protein
VELTVKERLEKMSIACDDLQKAVKIMMNTPYLEYGKTRHTVDLIVEQRLRIEKDMKIIVTKQTIEEIQDELKKAENPEIIKKLERKLKTWDRQLKTLTR